MNKAEAKGLLEEFLGELKERPRQELLGLLSNPVCFEKTGKSGTVYQIEYGAGLGLLNLEKTCRIIRVRVSLFRANRDHQGFLAIHGRIRQGQGFPGCGVFVGLLLAQVGAVARGGLGRQFGGLSRMHVE